MSHLERLSLTSALALIVASTVGCGANQGASAPVLPQSNAATLPGAFAQPEKGGRFTGSYSGSFSARACGARHDGHFDFRGTGDAQYIGSSSESGTLLGSKYRGADLCDWFDIVRLTSTARKGDYVVLAVDGQHENVETPCNQRLDWHVKYGEGEFNGANGAGKVTIACTAESVEADHRSSGTYVDRWTGRLTFTR